MFAKIAVTTLVLLALAAQSDARVATQQVVKRATIRSAASRFAPTARQETFVADLDYAPDGSILVASYRNRPPAVVINESGRIQALLGYSPSEEVARERAGKAVPRGADLLFDRNSLLRRSADVTCVTFAPDGKKIAAAGPGIVKIFDAQTGKQERSIEALENAAINHVDDPGEFSAILTDLGGEGVLGGAFSAGSLSVSYSPDGSRLAVCEPYGCSVRDVKSGAQIYNFHHTDKMGGRYFAMYSPDGKYLAVICHGALSDRKSCRVDVLEAAGGKPVFSYTAEGAREPYGDLAFSADSSVLGFCTAGGKVRVYECKDFSLRSEVPGGDRIAFSPDGDKLAATLRDDGARLVDTHSGAVLRTYAESHPDLVRGIRNRPLSWSRDGKWLAIGGEEFCILFWKVI